MKTFTTILLAFVLSSNFLAQGKVQISEKKHTFSDNEKSAFFIELPYGSEDEVSKILKKELKKWKGSFSSKKEYFVDDVKMKEMGENTFDIYATVVEKEADQCDIVIAVDLGGAYINATAHPDRYSYMKERLTNFGIKVSKDVMSLRIEEEEKKLEKLNGELEGLKKDKEKLVKTIANSNAELAANEATLKHTDKSTEEGEKAAKKLEKQIKKNQDDIKNAENEIPKNEQKQEDKKKEISNQEKVIESMNTKKDEIN